MLEICPGADHDTSCRRRFWLFIGLGVFMLASIASAQNVATSTMLLSGAMVEESPDNARILNQLLPVITMEQFHSGPVRIQGYRVRIFKNGNGFYDGIKNVKTLGQVSFEIPPEGVQRILDQFEKYKFWQTPSDQLGRSPFSVLVLEFTLRDGLTIKTIRFSSQLQGSMLLSVVESEVNSAKWRCPYEDEHRAKVCVIQDQYLERAVPIFTAHEFPKLLETYK
ncbi:hypothetical protein D3C87_1270200 [compost metagenome]